MRNFKIIVCSTFIVFIPCHSTFFHNWSWYRNIKQYTKK